MIKAYAGIDIGSRYTKIVLARGEGRQYLLFDTFKFYKEYLDTNGFSIGKLCADADFGVVNPVCGFTGYGKNRIASNWKHALFNELKMHMLGAMEQTGMLDFTMLDIGGQDSKVVSVKNGKMVDFETNDKCAAGTGRFVENAARVMGMELSEFMNCKDSPVEITSKCAVFAETEIIELLAQNVSPERIAAGINQSVVKKVLPLIERFNYNKYLIFSGGTANNPAVLEFLQQQLSEKYVKITVLDKPLFNGAIGVVSSLIKMEDIDGHSTF